MNRKERAETWWQQFERITGISRKEIKSGAKRLPRPEFMIVQKQCNAFVKAFCKKELAKKKKKQLKGWQFKKMLARRIKKKRAKVQ